MMCSVTVLKFDNRQSALIEVAHDYGTNWSCALEVFCDGTFLIAEASGNLATIDRCRSNLSLRYKAKMHLGDVVSCFSRGSLSSGDEWPNTSDDDSAMPLVFGCVSGALGCIIPIDEVTHNLLEHLSFALLDFLTTMTSNINPSVLFEMMYLLRL